MNKNSIVRNLFNKKERSRVVSLLRYMLLNNTKEDYNNEKKNNKSTITMTLNSNDYIHTFAKYSKFFPERFNYTDIFIKPIAFNGDIYICYTPNEFNDEDKEKSKRDTAINAVFGMNYNIIKTLYISNIKPSDYEYSYRKFVISGYYGAYYRSLGSDYESKLKFIRTVLDNLRYVHILQDDFTTNDYYSNPDAIVLENGFIMDISNIKYDAIPILESILCLFDLENNQTNGIITPDTNLDNIFNHYYIKELLDNFGLTKAKLLENLILYSSEV